MPADPDHVRRVLGAHREARLDEAGAVLEQPDGLHHERFVEGGGCIGHLERADTPDLLTGQPEWLTARGEHVETVGLGQERVDHRSNGVEHVLTVVDYEERPPPGERAGDGIDEVDSCGLAHLEGAGDRSQDERRIRER